ncbi:hypothetical protein [Roseibium sp.]|uniref:hypothetical protein n=1 Tax=Roseibium sp. TaxID=1936156 RepID=UPI003A97E54F
MKSIATLAFSSGLAASVVCADATMMVPGDFYLISRGVGGDFIGSHKIYQRRSDGMAKVTYCGREYWVRPVTVAWTEIEVENRNQVRVEFNFGKGWRPICNSPEKQVTLRDLGVTQEARIVLGTNGRDLDATNRFSAIRDSFQTGNERRKTSFHRE